MSGQEIWINSLPALPGTLTIEREVHTVSSALPRPNPAWSTTDAAGHFHAAAHEFDAEPSSGGQPRVSYPTLNCRAEHVGCDGSCGGTCGGEGYTVEHYVCRICGAPVEPGVLTGVHSVSVPGRYDWRAEVVGGRELVALHGAQVTVRTSAGRDVVLGVALGADLRVEGGSDGITARLTLVGAGPIGRVPR